MTAAATASPWPAGHRPRWHVPTRHALPLCAALSLAVHAMVLGLRLPTNAGPAQAAHVPAATAPERIQVRLNATRDAGPLAVPSGSNDARASSHITPSGRAARAPARLAPEPAPEQPDSSGAETLPTPGAIPPAVESTLARPTAPSPGTAERDEYVPRPLLSVPPVVQAPVIIGAPAREARIGRYMGMLSLFIDERGEVRHIDADDPLLPAELEQAAREAFMAARFAPGQLDGRAVKSRIRVEVAFDNTPIALPTH